MITTIRKNSRTLLILAVSVFIFSIPTFVFGWRPGDPIVPCAGSTVGLNDHDCTYGDFIRLGSNIISYLTLLSIPLAAIAFAWAGVRFLTARGDEAKVKKAKDLFGKVLLGFVFVLTAWLIVYTLTHLFLSPEYQSAVPLR